MAYIVQNITTRHLASNIAGKPAEITLSCPHIVPKTMNPGQKVPGQKVPGHKVPNLGNIGYKVPGHKVPEHKVPGQKVTKNAT